MGLEDYTDKELRDELKRRADKRNAVNYVSFTGKVVGIHNIRWNYNSGKPKYLPYQFWEFIVESDFFAQLGVKLCRFYAEITKVPKRDSPCIGDSVLLSFKKGRNIKDAKIVSVIKE